MGWGGVEGSYFMPVEWDPRPAIAQTLALEQGPQQPSPIQGHRRPYNGTYSSVSMIKGLQNAISNTFPLSPVELRKSVNGSTTTIFLLK